MGSQSSPSLPSPPMAKQLSQTPHDCSQGFCNMHCPQWCYFLLPPPPLLNNSDEDYGDSTPALSPLVIALVALTAASVLVIAYYTAYKCFRHRRHHHYPGTTGDIEEAPTGSFNGLDETLINKITVQRYRKGDGSSISGTNCPVCLCDFREDESLRLLPKCHHAFHVCCIDTWLRSHPNCPLCRAAIIPTRLPVSENQDRNPVGQESESTELSEVALELGEPETVFGDHEDAAKGSNSESLDDDIRPVSIIFLNDDDRGLRAEAGGGSTV